MYGTGRDLLAVQERVHDDEELLVLPTRRLEQLLPAVRAGLPVDEEGRGPARVGVRLEALGQTAATAAGSAQYSITKKSPT